MICYGYDYKEYIQTRGLYMNLCDELPGGCINQKQLIEIIKRTPNEHDMNLIYEFKHKYVSAYGNATELCLNNIIDNIKNTD